MIEGSGVHRGIGENGRQPNDLSAQYWNEMRHAYFRRRAAANDSEQHASPAASIAAKSASLLRVLRP